MGGSNTGFGEKASQKPRDWNFDWQERKEVGLAQRADCLGFKINKVPRLT